jgi:hypothetical protein
MLSPRSAVVEDSKDGVCALVRISSSVCWTRVEAASYLPFVELGSRLACWRVSVCRCSPPYPSLTLRADILPALNRHVDRVWGDQARSR